MILVETARIVARALHCNQVYGEKLDYYYHLDLVVSILKQHSISDPETLAAAWLHDSIEDQKLKLQFLADEFGYNVAMIVYAVTNEIGTDRKEKNEKTWPKIRDNEKAIQVKLADRIANISHGLMHNNFDMLSMYLKEHDAFIKAIIPDNIPKTTKSLLRYLQNSVDQAKHIIEQKDLKRIDGD